MLNIVKYRNIWFAISGVLLIAGIVALALYGLRLGIDFKGGTIGEVKFTQNSPESAEVQQIIRDNGSPEAQVQKTDQGTYIIRTANITPEQHEAQNGKLIEKFGPGEELRYDQVGPTVSKEITRRAIYQLVLVSLGILLYVAWAFKRVPRPLSSWRFGWAAIIALIHDLLLVIGVFAILGQFMHVEIDAMFVTALLTILGFSVHDTIIVFDRIRENLRRLSGLPFDQIVGRSINQTIVRSINTSSTVVFVLLAMLLFGGENIRYFVVALIVGIVSGVYSSIFIASPLLYVFHRKRFK